MSWLTRQAWCTWRAMAGDEGLQGWPSHSSSSLSRGIWDKLLSDTLLERTGAASSLPWWLEGRGRPLPWGLGEGMTQVQEGVLLQLSRAHSLHQFCFSLQGRAAEAGLLAVSCGPGPAFLCAVALPHRCTCPILRGSEQEHLVPPGPDRWLRLCNHVGLPCPGWHSCLFLPQDQRCASHGSIDQTGRTLEELRVGMAGNRVSQGYREPVLCKRGPRQLKVGYWCPSLYPGVVDGGYDLLHPFPFPRASFEMSLQSLAAEQSFETNTVPVALEKSPLISIFLWHAILELVLPERVWMEQTNRKGG